MGKSTTTKQENSPPKWAEPLLRQSADEAMRLYNSGAGYTPYSGPTQAPLSDVTLGGMNSLLAATGYGGAPVSNEGINSLIPTAEIQEMIRQAQARNAAAKPAQPAKKALPEPYARMKENYDISRGGYDRGDGTIVRGMPNRGR